MPNVISGNRYRGRKTFLVVGFVLSPKFTLGKLFINYSRSMNDIKKFLATVTGKIVSGILLLFIIFIVIAVATGSTTTPTISTTQNTQPNVLVSNLNQANEPRTTTPVTVTQAPSSSTPIMQKVVISSTPPPVVTQPVPPVMYAVDITFPGNGDGTITSSPAGVTCVVGKCSGTFSVGTSVILTATPTGGSSFVGWLTTDDSCLSTNTCTVKISGPIWVMAKFNAPPPTPTVMSGYGNMASKQFNLQAGLAVFSMQYTGQSNFIVHLLDSNGNAIESLSNVIGNYNGSNAVQIPSSGSYLFNVQADGWSWSITVNQPQPTNVSSATNLNGFGDKATDFFNLTSGLHTFNFSYNGQSNFIVHLLDADGNRIESLANEIGNYNGSQAVHIDSSGPYILNVQAEGGNWRVSIQ